jgi:hypothetical protein
LARINEAQAVEIMLALKPSIEDANSYYTNHLQSSYQERDDVIQATTDYYNNKFKNLSKIPLTTSEVYDTIMWILPALVETFSSSDDVVTIQGENAEDDKRAQKVQQLINYQTERLNDGFMNRYFWMLSALMNNIGFLKLSWKQERRTDKLTGQFDDTGLADLQANPEIKVGKTVLVSQGNGFDVQSIHSVEYERTVITENRPLVEVIPVTEVSWASNTKKLKDAQFVKHRVRRTVDYLLQKEKSGLYFDIKKARELAPGPKPDQLRDKQRDYAKEIKYGNDDLRREIEIDECYCQYPMNENFKKSDRLHDWIFHVAGETVLIGAQYNNMGRRHPIIDLVAMPDPWNVVPKKGIVEILAEIQHIMTALTRLFVRHLVVSNEGRRFVNKEKVDQDDLINESPDIAVDGNPKDAVFPMPPTTLSPMTLPFMQQLDARRSKSIGVTEYNTGTSAAQLNDTATGVTALIDQANKRIKLIARVMAETGYTEFYRFLIALNQKFPSQKQYIRLLNETIETDPSDLEGKLDLVLNAGMGTTNKQAEFQNLQLLMKVLGEIDAKYPGMVTPDKAYNLAKMMLETLGKKDVSQFINDPQFYQQLQMMMAENQQMKAMIAEMGGVIDGITGAATGAIEGSGQPGDTGQGGPTLPVPGAGGPASGIPG